MRQFLYCIATCVISTAATYFVTHNAMAKAPHTAIVADEKAGVVRIVIDGNEVARFGSDGLEVRHDIKFGGVITDQGIAGFNHEGKGE